MQKEIKEKITKPPTQNMFQRNKSLQLILTIGIILIACSAFQEDLTLDEIIARHAEAIGGKEGWKGLKTYQIITTRDAEDGKFTSIATMKRPNKYRLDFKSENSHRIKSYNGEEGWYGNNGLIEDMRPGEEIEMAEEGSYYEELALSFDFGYELEMLGTEEVLGKPHYVIKMIKSEKDHQFYYIDSETFLITMTKEFSEDKQYEGIEFKTIMSDYKEVNGLMFPFVIDLYANDKLMRLFIKTNVETNIDVDNDFFERPLN